MIRRRAEREVDVADRRDSGQPDERDLERHRTHQVRVVSRVREATRVGVRNEALVNDTEWVQRSILASGQINLTPGRRKPPSA